MTGLHTSGYGSWKSPIKAEQVASAALGLGEIQIADGRVYWLEFRPAEGGRYVVVRQDPGGAIDAIPAGFNARTRVHEYGGGAYLAHGETVFFSNFADQRLYRVDDNGRPRAITPAGDIRYADAVADGARRRLIAVREDHTDPGAEPVNCIAAIGTAGGSVETLVSGNDFYASPRLSPDCSALAWLTWNHPHMPWEAAELWVAPVNADDTLGKASHVAGSPHESIVQPEWSPDGVLYFISDRSNWWNLYRRVEAGVEALTNLEAEFAVPQWQFRPSTYAFASPEEIICTYNQNGFWRLASLNTSSGTLDEIETPYATITDICVADGQAVFIGGSSSEPRAIVRMDLCSRATEVLRRASELRIDPRYISIPEPIAFSTGGGRTAYGLFYRPKNADFIGPADERPPLLVKVHGGPTAAAAPSFQLSIQYYTSRGIAVLDVNYGGSSGYGREYRQRLNGQWGGVDVDDTVNGAMYLVRRGEVDGRRLAIAGGSAGGYTTLSALTFRDTFAVGASRYGVSDCEALARETHKFESHYLDSLIGPYPQRRDTYIERSPIQHTDKLSRPIIFLQGLDDKIVPPDQAEKMVQALREKGLPVAYLAFEGEQHGFRKSENIKRALEAELYFFSRIFGFELGEPVEPVPIENVGKELG